MSPNHSVYRWNTAEEQNFIKGLGTYSSLGKEIGRAQLLKNYREAMKRFDSAEKGWNKKQRMELLREAEKIRGI